MNLFDIRRIITSEEIEHEYQPMWNLTSWEIYGYEALIRIPGQMNTDLESIFQMAREQELLFELDTLSIRRAIQAFPIHYLKDEQLFVNVFPSTLVHREFEAFLQKLVQNHPGIRGKVVFELNETIVEGSIWDIPLLKEKVTLLKSYGLSIAIDDIGKGVGTFQKIIELSPDFIKLDRYFSISLSKTKEKQEMITLLNDYCRGRMGLVLEGIEEAVDLAYAKYLKVPLGQGYLLGKPEKVPESLMKKEVEKMKKEMLRII
jgi:EAL domain-containing protein (putative c-di-GMP-specific phosphodiesterase class I)